ncbi:hypothetical protein TDB9533_00788 [Thalassocella blandensis]|nr:hypothetical protein TDB9533_00788 [Thalassocella blandensis]
MKFIFIAILSLIGPCAIAEKKTSSPLVMPVDLIETMNHINSGPDIEKVDSIRKIIVKNDGEVVVMATVNTSSLVYVFSLER